MKVRFVKCNYEQKDDFLKECRINNNMFEVISYSEYQYKLVSSVNEYGYWYCNKCNFEIVNEYEIVLDEDLFKL